MKVSEICQVLDGLAPPGFAYEWDRIGLRIGQMDTDVSKILVVLSVTGDAVAAAKKAKAELIIAHHAPLWNPLKVLRTDDPETKIWLDIAQSGMACYAAHTNLDIAKDGVNDALAEKLELEDYAPLFETPHVNLVKLVTFVPEQHLAPVREAVCEAGAGVIGDYTYCTYSSPGVGTFLPGEKSDPYSGKRFVVNEEAERRFEVQVHEARLPQVLEALNTSHPYEEVAYDIYPMKNRDPYLGLGVRGELKKAVTLNTFAANVRKALDIQHVRVTGDGKKKVQTIAAMGGAGGSQIRRVPKDVDVFITGDVTYHDAQFAIERGLAVIDAGHHGTEKWIVPKLAAWLRKQLEGVSVSTFNEPDPFNAVTK